MADELSPAIGSLADYLVRAESVILPRQLSETAQPLPGSVSGELRVGVDLGTAYLVLAVLDTAGNPVAGEWQFAQVVRDGLVVDFMGAADLLRGMKQRVERRIGRQLTHAATGYPPGVPQIEARAKMHVIEAAGMDCTGAVGEPSAANQLLRLRDGAIADIGGGTTGIAVLRGGSVVHTADEATGGTHFSLVIAGALDISFEEAEALKVRSEEQPRLLPLVRPVMEKVASIVMRHVQGWNVPSVTLVGGCSSFAGMADVVRQYTGLPAEVPHCPMLVTPLGLALSDHPR